MIIKNLMGQLVDYQPKLDIEIECLKCEGRGNIRNTCFTCEGTGEITDTCPDCNGDGYKGSDEFCEECDGNGRILRTKPEFKILSMSVTTASEEFPD